MGTTKTSVRIRKISLAEIGTEGEAYNVEVEISDSGSADTASIHITAKLPVKRRGHSLESMEAATVDAIMEALKQAASKPVQKRMKAVY